MSQDVRLHEPLGERSVALPLTIGGAGATIVVPGEFDAPLQLLTRAGQWWLHPAANTHAQLNGALITEPVALTDDDVIGVGSAQIIVQPSAGHIQVSHLLGNATVAPVVSNVLPGEAVDSGVREIFAARAADALGAAGAEVRHTRRMSPLLLVSAAVGVAVIGVALWLLFRQVPVALSVTPLAARVETAGLLEWRIGERVLLAPGHRTLTISSPGYRSQRITLNVTRALADAAPLPVQLQLLPGELVVDTHGIAGELLVDGKSVARVPGTVTVEAGDRDLIVRAPRHVDLVTRLRIEGAGRRQSLDAPLQPAFGWLQLDTAPLHARISIDGEYRGDAPQKLELDSGVRRLSITATGRRAWNSEIAIIAGQVLDLGTIDLAAPPPPRALPVVAAVENTAQITAPPVPAPPAARVQSALLGTLVLLPAGSYTQGSDRREQGRRANEAQRRVTLTRAFYLSEREVNIAQFRAFRATHLAGLAMDRSLDLDAQAASNMSWNDAVEFCNWLSQREGLPLAYERRDNRWQLVEPRNTGYRLPTEAEWEYAARYVDGQRWQRFAWGDALPPSRAAANLAGQESLPTKPGPEVRLASALPDYRDEHPVIAPVGSYAATSVGLHDMGGNVSEWTHDVYASLPEAGPVTDPLGPSVDGVHAIRGASWRTSAIAQLRLAWRERAAGPAQHIGFRVARHAQELP
jgi:formylglycine-generating enzyme required for sulfatase activity